MSEEKNGLVGKYVYISNEEYYSTGKIIEKVDDSFYLVKKDAMNNNGRENVVLYATFQMIPSSELDIWFFFDTKEELNDYVKWLESPTEETTKENNVLKLVKE